MRLLLSLVLGLTAVALGNPANAEVEIRVSGGRSSTRIDYQPHPLWYKSRVSGDISAYASLRMVGPTNEALRLESGFDFGKRGGSLRLQYYEGYTDRVSVKWDETTLTIPILLRFQANSGEFVKLGVGIDFLGIDRTVEGGFSPLGQSQPRSYDALLMAGVGADGNLLGVPFFVEAEASVGLLNVESEASQSSLRNRTLRIGLGLIWDESLFAPPGNDESDE